MPWNLTGHEWAANLLCQHVARGEMRHAYLITGPAGVGRRTLALRLAQAVNCTQPPAPGEACGACRSCTQIERMSHPDLSILQAGREGGEIPVDAVRQLQRSLNLAPYEARYRVALLLRFEEATPSAQNALLKTLEEAPERVILLLTAENAEALLPTIVSRCEILRLRPLPLDVVRASLSARGIPAEQANLLAHVCGGRAGLAFRLSHDGAQMEQRAAWLDDLWRLLHANRAERFAYAEHAASGCAQPLPGDQSLHHRRSGAHSRATNRARHGDQRGGARQDRDGGEAWRADPAGLGHDRCRGADDRRGRGPAGRCAADGWLQGLRAGHDD